MKMTREDKRLPEELCQQQGVSADNVENWDLSPI